MNVWPRCNSRPYCGQTLPCLLPFSPTSALDLSINAIFALDRQRFCSALRRQLFFLFSKTHVFDLFRSSSCLLLSRLSLRLCISDACFRVRRLCSCLHASRRLLRPFSLAPDIASLVAALFFPTAFRAPSLFFLDHFSCRKDGSPHVFRRRRPRVLLLLRAPWAALSLADRPRQLDDPRHRRRDVRWSSHSGPARGIYRCCLARSRRAQGHRRAR